MAMNSTLQIFIVSVACFMVVQALRKDHDKTVLNGKQKKKFWGKLITPEPRCEKTALRGFRAGPTQTGLYSHTRWLEA